MVVVFGCLRAVATSAEQSPASSEIQLRGALVLDGKTAALIAWADEKTASLLYEGQQEVHRGRNLEVVSIDPHSGRVKAKLEGEVVQLLLGGEQGKTFSAAAGEVSADRKGSVRFSGATTEDLLLAYELFSERTLLRPSNLPGSGLTLRSGEDLPFSFLAKGLAAALYENGILVTNVLNLFVVAVPQQDWDRIGSRIGKMAAALKDSAKEPGAGSEQKLILPGMLHFRNADLSQALQVYGELKNATILRPTTLPWKTMSLRVASPLSRAEVVFCFEAALALEDIAVRPFRQSAMMVYPAFLETEMESLTKHQFVAHDLKDQRTLAEGAVNFQQADLRQVMRVYTELDGRETVCREGTEDTKVTLRTQQPMTKAEVLACLDMVLAMNGVEVVEAQGSAKLEAIKMKSPVRAKTPSPPR
jgi:hypothetical protein